MTTLEGGLTARKTLPQAPTPRPLHGSIFLDEFVLRVLRDALFPLGVRVVYPPSAIHYRSVLGVLSFPLQVSPLQVVVVFP